jgi:hypothetical protein
MASGLTSLMWEHINANKELDGNSLELSFCMLAVVDDCIDTFI